MNILWDFDGTLFETYTVLVEGFLKISGLDLDKQEVRDDFNKGAKYLFKKNNVCYETYAQVLRNYERDQSADLKPPFENVWKVLQFADKNFIVTHKEREPMMNILEHYGMKHFFTDFICVNEQFPRKPDTGSYKYLHDKYGVDLVIGDRDFDLIPAKRLGIKSCIFNGDSEFADYKLNNYDEFFTKVLTTNFDKDKLFK